MPPEDIGFAYVLERIDRHLESIDRKLDEKASISDVKDQGLRLRNLEQRMDAADVVQKQKSNALTRREKLFGMFAVAIGLCLQVVLIVHPF